MVKPPPSPPNPKTTQSAGVSYYNLYIENGCPILKGPHPSRIMANGARTVSCLGVLKITHSAELETL